MSKKRGIVEAKFDSETLEEHIPETTNDVRECVCTGVLDFGEEIN